MTQWAARPHHKGESFISDGPLNWDRWRNRAPSRVLFLLKEAYGDFGELSDELRDGPFGKGWWTAAYWAYGLHMMEAAGVPDFPYDQDPTVRASFGRSAVVNIKKSAGKSRSDNDDLKRYAELDGALIKKQVDGLQPHYVICGGTWRHVRHLWPDARQVSDLVYCWKYPAQVRQTLILDYWHPAVPWPDFLTYYAIIAMAQKARLKIDDGPVLGP